MTHDRKEQNREVYRKNRDKILCQQKAYRDSHKESIRSTKLKQYYGITLAEYTIILGKQGGTCALCPMTQEQHISKYGMSLVIDHDHRTGRIRGILCTNHNVGIGRFNDSPGALREAARYIEENS